MKQRAFLVLAALSLASFSLTGCIAQEPDEIDETDEIADETENTMEAEQELYIECGQVMSHCLMGCSSDYSCEQICLTMC
jgi:hypothetical protein